jgi:GT2 family glycosyltransferase/SAM-dependent methyltransferase
MSGYVPLDVVEVDLRQGLDALVERAGGDRDVYAVLWWDDVPLGARELTRGQLKSRATVASLVAEAIAPAVADRTVGPGLFAPDKPGDPAGSPGGHDLARIAGIRSPLAMLPPSGDGEAAVAAGDVSVVVATRGRPESLARLLESLGRLASAPAEVIVVDNGADGGTRALVARHAFATYVAEPRAGLSIARNTGIRGAHGSIVAFTDDDAIVDPRWLDRLCAGFETPNVTAVTGLVLPARLDSPIQVLFERGLGWFAHGFRRRTFDAGFFARTRARGVPVWAIGAGVNLAVRRAAFDRVGPFDERLGAGASGCSEDSELLYRILAQGGECRYEPDAVVRHDHRAELTELERQVHDYIRGHVSALFVQFAHSRDVGNLRRALVAIPAQFLGRVITRLPVDDPLRRARGAEVRGYVHGLALAGWARRPATAGKSPLSVFLRANPYPRPHTEGLFYREKMRAIHRVAPDRALEHVLEVGGGTSGLTALLYPGASVVNLDADPSAAASPVNRDRRTTFVVGDATRLPFPDASFDGVTMFDLLEHVADHNVAVTEARRVLRPHGFLLVSSPNEHWRFPYFAPFRPICPSEEEMFARWGHVRRGYSIAELARLIGVEPTATATFITPLTSIAHDLGFSRLPRRTRRTLGLLASPLAWAGYVLHRPDRTGTETASCWEPV